MDQLYSVASQNGQDVTRAEEYFRQACRTITYNEDDDAARGSKDGFYDYFDGDSDIPPEEDEERKESEKKEEQPAAPTVAPQGKDQASTTVESCNSGSNKSPEAIGKVASPGALMGPDTSTTKSEEEGEIKAAAAAPVVAADGDSASALDAVIIGELNLDDFI